MSASKARAGERRSLTGSIAAAGAARVLDLHLLSLDPPDDADYAGKPLFAHPVLNRAILMKYNVPSGHVDKLAPRRFNITKILFPYDQDDLDLGGQALFVDQPNFVTSLTRLLDYTDLPIDRDLSVLRALDRLPTLDPFLIHETLKQQKLEVGRCYFRLSQDDRSEMLSFVAGEIEALIRPCFGEGESNEKHNQRMSQLLLAEQDSQDLAPLREVFRMNEAQFSDAMFCWKAFLFYRWRSQVLIGQVKPTLRALAGIRAGRYQQLESVFVSGAKRQIERSIAGAWREVGAWLKQYDEAFAAFTRMENLDSFRAFLMRGSGPFLELGDRIGRVEQAVSFWNHTFSAEKLVALSPYEVLDGLRDLIQALSIGVEPGSQDEGRPFEHARLTQRPRRRTPAARPPAAAAAPA